MYSHMLCRDGTRHFWLNAALEPTKTPTFSCFFSSFIVRTTISCSCRYCKSNDMTDLGHCTMGVCMSFTRQLRS